MERLPSSCRDIDELAGLYVLDALEPSEMMAVSAHLQACPESHALFAELATASSQLLQTVDLVDTPPAMKDRLMSAIATTPQVPDLASIDSQRPAPSAALAAPQPAAPDPGATAPPPVMTPDDRRTSWLDRLRGSGTARPHGWALAGLATGALVIVLVGAGILGALRLSMDESDRLGLLRQAVAAASSEQANVAVLTGDASTAGAFGYAVFPDDGDGFIVIDGLQSLAADEAYQAWFLVDGQPSSAGLLDVKGDGLGTLTGLDPDAGTTVIAVTVEDAPGVEAPTSDPILAGELRAATAAAGSRLAL